MDAHDVTTEEVAVAVATLIRGYVGMHHALAARLGVNLSGLAAMLHIGGTEALPQEELRTPSA